MNESSKSCYPVKKIAGQDYRINSFAVEYATAKKKNGPRGREPLLFDIHVFRVVDEFMEL